MGLLIFFRDKNISLYGKLFYSRGGNNMKIIVKVLKRPITWIVCALACVIGVIIWLVTGREDTIESLKD